MYCIIQLFAFLFIYTMVTKCTAKILNSPMDLTDFGLSDKEKGIKKSATCDLSIIY